MTRGPSTIAQAEGMGHVLSPPTRELAVGLQFTETMRGYFALGADHVERACVAAGFSPATLDFAPGARQGRAEGSRFAFTLSIIAEDLDAMLADPAHPARMIGTVAAPALSPRPLTATEGVFNLFVDGPGSVEFVRFKLCGSSLRIENNRRVSEMRNSARPARHSSLFVEAGFSPADARLKAASTIGAEPPLEPAAGPPVARRMLYRIKLTADDGREYWLEGFKEIRRGRARHWWHDLTTLYITLRDGSGGFHPASGLNSGFVLPSGGGAKPPRPVLGRGVLTISFADLLRQLTTLRATHAGKLTERLKADARFARFFAGALYKTYLGRNS